MLFRFKNLIATIAYHKLKTFIYVAPEYENIFSRDNVAVVEQVHKCHKNLTTMSTQHEISSSLKLKRGLENNGLYESCS